MIGYVVQLLWSSVYGRWVKVQLVPVSLMAVKGGILVVE
jgi:hypothetical protein